MMDHCLEYKTKNKWAYFLCLALFATSFSACGTVRLGKKDIIYQFPDDVEVALLTYLSKEENCNKAWLVFFQTGKYIKVSLVEMRSERSETPSLSAIARKSNRLLDLAGRRLPIVFKSDIICSRDWNVEGEDGMITSSFLFGGGFYVEFEGGFRSGSIVSSGFDF